MNNAEIKFNEHAVFMSEIALDLLIGNDKCLAIPGVRELIGLYLLIPYITHKRLITPGNNYRIPKLKLSEKFTGTITLERLRHSLCHSFVSVEQSDEKRLGRIILDDRSEMDKKPHDSRVNHSTATSIDVLEARKRLLELHEKVMKMQSAKLITGDTEDKQE